MSIGVDAWRTREEESSSRAQGSGLATRFSNDNNTFHRTRCVARSGANRERTGGDVMTSRTPQDRFERSGAEHPGDSVDTEG